MLVIMLAPLWGGCRAAGGDLQQYDLLENFEIAELESPTRLIRAGERDSWHHLADGWWSSSPPVEKPSEFWGVGSQSTLEFTVFEATDRGLSWRARSLPSASGEQQMVAVRVNGFPVGAQVLDQQFKEYEVELPGQLLKPGRNRLEFIYRIPPEKLRHPRPELAALRLTVAWQWIRFDAGTGPEDAVAELQQSEGDPVLRIPLGTQVTYYLAETVNAELWIERAETAEGGASLLAQDAVLEVEIESAAGGTHRFELGGRSGGLRRLELPDFEEAFRITLRARGDGEQSRHDAAFLVARAELRGARVRGPENPEMPSTMADASTERVLSLTATESEAAAPNVLIFLIDALRADRVGAYGYAKSLTPYIDELAEQGVRYENAFAQSGWTRPSMASVFTGLYPPMHGATRREHSLPEPLVTMAEILKERGYQTGGFTSNVILSEEFGFAQGFDEYLLVGVPQLYSNVSRWLGLRDTGRPFLLFVHVVDPHDPYDPPEDFRSRFAPDVPSSSVTSVREVGQALDRDKSLGKDQIGSYFSALYDAEAAYADSELGRVLGLLENEGLFDQTLIVLLSDHGEEFLDHGRWAHGHTLYDELLRIPLVIKFPGDWNGGTAIEEPAQHVDILPTILEYLGMESTERHDGRVLPPVSGEIDHERPTLAFSDYYLRDFQALRLGNWKLIRSYPSTTFPSRLELYDLAADPGESSNLARRQPVRAGYMESLLKEWFVSRLGDLGSGEAIPLTDEMRERLRALGYIR